MNFKSVDPNHKIGIMLVDDLIYTSNTCLQAKYFLERELEGHENEYDIIFSPLYCRGSSEIPVEQIKDMLITNYIEKPLNDEQARVKANEYLSSLH